MTANAANASRRSVSARRVIRRARSNMIWLSEEDVQGCDNTDVNGCFRKQRMPEPFLKAGDNEDETDWNKDQCREQGIFHERRDQQPCDNELVHGAEPLQLITQQLQMPEQSHF